MAPDSSSSPKRSSAFTLRGLILGLGLAVLLCWLTPIVENVVHTTQISQVLPPIGAFFLFLLLVALSFGLWRRIHARSALTPAEMLLSFAMMGVVAGIPGIGLVYFLLPAITGPFYFARPENRYQEAIQPHLPTWLAPHDLSVIRPFYEGLPPNEAIPWAAWTVPVISWTIFSALVFWIMFCLGSLVARTWIRHERLTFPLIAMPLEIVREEGMLSARRRPLLILGILIPVVLHSINSLHQIYPTLPEGKIRGLNFALPSPPWSGLNPLSINIYPFVTAFAYFIPNELSFSFWFFYLLRKLETVAGVAFGFTTSMSMETVRHGTEFPYLQQQATGAFLAVAVMSIWLARRHIGKVFRAAIGRRDPDFQPEEEPLAPGWTVWGLLIGFILLIVWCNAAGMSVWVAVVSMGVFFAFCLAYSRIASEGGVVWVVGSMPLPDFMNTTFGSAAINRTSWIALQSQSHLSDDTRNIMMPNLMHGFKIADAAKMNKRKVTWALWAASVAGIVFSFYAALYLAYRFPGGAINLSSPRYAGRGADAFKKVISLFDNPTKPQWNEIGFMGVGAAITWVLVFLRTRFASWPLHPIGYAFANTWGMDWFWFAVFTAWVIKTVVTRYGGYRGFVRSLPFFHGLIIGEFAAMGFWAVVEYALGIRHHRLFP